MWLQTIHKNNILNKVNSNQFCNNLDNIKLRFNINLDLNNFFGEL